MDNKKLIIILFTVNLCLLIAASAFFFFRSSTKIGYVESAQLMSELKSIATGNQQLSQVVAEHEAELNQLESEISQIQAIAAYDKENQDAQAKLKELSAGYKAKYQEAQTAISEAESAIMQPIYNAINEAISEYGKDNGYKMIFGALNGGNILYGDEGINLTEELVEYLNERE